MSNKTIMLITLILLLGFIIYGCDTRTGEIFPSAIPLEDSIKEIINSKGDNYDFLKDELYKKKLDEFVLTLNENVVIEANHYAIGNLDDDNIPELVLFIERNPDEINDKGKLEVYKFTGERYQLLDTTHMNYDNTNYLLEVGKLSLDKNGILLSNQVGAHAGITYGYILENGKLVEVLNDKKISLISVYTKNEIKDIDGDGILEFSIYTIDPETEEKSSAGSDKLILWYKWDGFDSGELVQIDREPGMEPFTKKESTESDYKDTLYDIDPVDFINHLKQNISDYNKFEISDLILTHIDELELTLNDRSLEVEKLFTKYQQDYIQESMFDKYGLSKDRLNDLDYLKRERTLQSELDLKEHLIKNIQKGYKVDTSEGMYYYVINHQRFLDNFAEAMTKEYRDYLRIKTRNTIEPYLRDGALVINRDKLAERIVEIESFRMTYPYTSHLKEVNKIYQNYVLTFLYGSDNTPNYDNSTNKFSEGSVAVFQNTINKYPDTHFSDILRKMVQHLQINLNIITEPIKESVNKLIK